MVYWGHRYGVKNEIEADFWICDAIWSFDNNYIVKVRNIWYSLKVDHLKGR